MDADARKIWVAGAALLWEDAWPRVVPILSVAAFYASVSLLDIPRHVPVMVHGGVLAACAVTELLLLMRLCFLRWPGRERILRRQEQVSHLRHRPLIGRDDVQTTGLDNAVSTAFWALHRRRLATAAALVRPVWPHPNLPAKDPWGLRAGAVLALIVGVVVAGEDGWSRLAYGLTPPLPAQIIAGPKVEVWMTPPVATGLAPKRLEPGQSNIVTVPEGSIIRASVPKGWWRASLRIGSDAQDFDVASDGSQQVEMVAHRGDTLAVRRMLHTLVQWPINILVDQAPEVDFVRPPGPIEMDDGERRVQAAVSARDDWGVEKVWIEIMPEGLAVDLEPVRVDLPVSGSKPGSGPESGPESGPRSPMPKSVTVEARLDAQGSEFAGLSVTVTPKAQDGAGHVASGAPAHFVWPEIPYADPDAARLAAARKAFLKDPAQSDAAVDLMEEIGPQVDSPSVELDLSLASRDLTSPDFRPNEAQALMLGAAQRLEQRAQMRLSQLLDQLGQQLDKQLEKSGEGEQTQSMASFYADLLEGLLNRQAKGGERLTLSPRQMDDIRHRLDQLAQRFRVGKKAGDKDALAQRLEDMAQRLENAYDKDKIGGKNGQSRDPLGHASQDDGTTQIPGQNTPTKARLLLDEIRRRAQDGQRPRPERDYLHRLMEGN